MDYRSWLYDIRPIISFSFKTKRAVCASRLFLFLKLTYNTASLDALDELALYEHVENDQRHEYQEGGGFGDGSFVDGIFHQEGVGCGDLGGDLREGLVDGTGGLIEGEHQVIDVGVVEEADVIGVVPVPYEGEDGNG